MDQAETGQQFVKAEDTRPIPEGTIIRLGPGECHLQEGEYLVVRDLTGAPNQKPRLMVAPLEGANTGGAKTSVAIGDGDARLYVALDQITSIAPDAPPARVGAITPEEWRHVHRALHALFFVPQPLAGNNLPFARPSIDAEEAGEVMDTLASDWLTTGPKTRDFETAFAAYVGAEHALAVNSCTSGLHLALEAIGIGEGDQVITTPYTFTASAEVIRYLGADPVFVDIDPATFNIDPQEIARALEKPGHNIKAIVPVHMAGQACDMAAIMELARQHGLKVVEDAAHALPTTCGGKMVGAIGDLTVFSFYATKTITTGEGGMVTTNDAAMAERMRMMRLHGIDRDVFDRYSSEKPAWYYEVAKPGFKYNMPDILAAIGVQQLKKADAFQQRRAEIAQKYNAAFRDIPARIPTITRVDDTHAWHLYILQLDLEKLSIDRDRFIELMAGEKLGTSVHFIPLHIQPYWRDRLQLRPEDFPKALDVYNRAVSLPIYPRMTDDDVDRVILATRKILAIDGQQDSA